MHLSFSQDKVRISWERVGQRDNNFTVSFWAQPRSSVFLQLQLYFLTFACKTETERKVEKSRKSLKWRVVSFSVKVSLEFPL